MRTTVGVRPAVVVFSRPGSRAEVGLGAQSLPFREIRIIQSPADIEKPASESFILLWNDDAPVLTTTIEKLALTLCLQPEKIAATSGVDEGSPWLVRNRGDAEHILNKWVKRERINEVNQVHFLAESLSLSAKPQAKRASLPQFQPYEQVANEPIWSTVQDEVTNEKSVLFLVHSMPMGGACKFLLDIVTQLHKSGYVVSIAVLGFRDNPWYTEFLKVTHDVFLLTNLVRPSDFPRLIQYLARSRRHRYIVASHTMLAYQLLPYLRELLPQCAFLDYTHIEFESEWPKGGYAIVSAKRHSLIDLSMVSSQHLKNWMVKHGAPTEQVRVCYTNINCDAWKPNPDQRKGKRQELGISNETTCILYPCRLVPQKRPAFLCNLVLALNRVVKQPFVVLIAGKGLLQNTVDQFIGEHNLQSVLRCIGSVPISDMVTLHDASDIFLLPSEIEGISLALFEAMGMESVPVISDVGGQRELVTKECGFVIPKQTDTRAEMAEYVRVLKELIEKPSLRIQMGRSARNRVRENFSLETMLDVFVECLKAAAVQRPSRPQTQMDIELVRDLATAALDFERINYFAQACEEQVLIKNKEIEALRATIKKLQRNPK